MATAVTSLMTAKPTSTRAALSCILKIVSKFAPKPVLMVSWKEEREIYSFKKGDCGLVGLSKRC